MLLLLFYLSRRSDYDFKIFCQDSRLKVYRKFNKLSYMLECFVFKNEVIKFLKIEFKLLSTKTQNR